MCYVSKRVMRSRVGQLRCLARLYVWHRLGTDEGTRVTDDRHSRKCRSKLPESRKVAKKKVVVKNACSTTSRVEGRR